nr:uncharacterized protein LOC127309647 [Lolium perenne]
MEYMAYIHASMVANQTGQTADLGPMPPFPGPAPNMPSKENFAAEYYGRTTGTGCSGNQGGGREITPVHHGGPSPGATPGTSPGTSPGPSPGGSSAASTGRNRPGPVSSGDELL